MTLKPCLTCGTPTHSSRCPKHRKPPRQRNHQDENLRRQILKDYIDHHGYICPGTIWCDKPNEPHPVRAGDLTVDHNLPQAYGGTLHHGYTIMCRTANSRRGTGGGR